jgi:hypothetical protein
MASNYKQQATADVLASELAAQLGLTVTWAFVDAVNVGANASGGTSPVLTIGTVTTGNGGVSVVVADQRSGTDAGWKDIVGNVQSVYTGTVYKVIYEANLTAIAVKQLAAVVPAILGKRGGVVEIWTTNSGQSAALGGAGLALKATISTNIYWPLSDMA